MVHYSPPGEECFVDDMLDYNDDERRNLPAAISPEPLWQLEFGSCWHRMQQEPITTNPNDIILDFGDDDSELESSMSQPVNSRPDSPYCDYARESLVTAVRRGEPYFPDWEVQMLAESQAAERVLQRPHQLSSSQRIFYYGSSQLG